jgi:DNA-directed RNA polymerase subunit H (RpoH/RPB5)
MENKLKTEYTLNDMIRVSFNTLQEMMIDRGIKEEELNNISSGELISLYSDNLIFDFNITKEVRVIYFMNDRFKKVDFEKYYLTETENESNNIILVSKNSLRSQNLNSIREVLKKDGRKIELQIFELENLLYNVYRHELVPKHEVITDEKEIELFKKRYYLTSILKIPHIQHTDAIAKYLNIKAGMLVKITRNSKASGIHETYRICV